jgi:hypothetical protein
MACSVASMVLMLSVSMTGGLFEFFHPGGRIQGPAPAGYGWGFANGNPDGYGYVDLGENLPIAIRTSEYHFPRYYAGPPGQLFFPTYYNPYISRGQRYIAYSGCGGDNPASGPPGAPSNMPVHPYNDTLNNKTLRPLPRFDGRIEATPINPGNSGLRP